MMGGPSDWNWFWMVDGVAACESEHTLRIDPPTRCGWVTKEDAEQEAARFAALRPGHKVEVKPREEHPHESMDDYEC